MRGLLSWAGLVGVVSYVVATIVGANHLEGYSHMYNTVSEVTVAGADQLPVVHALYALYNLCVVALGLYVVGTRHASSSPLLRRAFLFFIGVGITGLVMYWFPQDARTVPMTAAGKAHIALASLLSLFSMISMVMAGLAFRKDPDKMGMANYCFASFAVMFVTGGFSAASVAADASYGGLAERLVIGVFLQFMLVLSLWIGLRKPLDGAPGIRDDGGAANGF